MNIDIHTRALGIKNKIDAHDFLDEKYRKANDLAASTNRALAETSKCLKSKNVRLLEEVEELQCGNARLVEANDELKKGIYEKHLEIHSLFEFLLNIRGLG